MTIARLLPYPPCHARRQLPASRLASLSKIVASTLFQVVGLPPEKRDVDSSRIFVQSYAHDSSLQVLQALIWGNQDSPRMTPDEESIRKYTLQLAEKIAPRLDLQTLLDLTIGYSTIKGYKQRLKAVLNAAAEARGSVQEAIEKDLAPAFTLLLSPQSSSNQAQGLYGLRKTAHCIFSFLRVSPPSFIRLFARSKHFILAIAHAYDVSLASIATSYGGLNVLHSAINRPSDAEIDDWERIWMDTKVALIDSFHILLSQLVEDMASAEGRSLGIEAERTFDIVFALLEHSSTISSTSSTISLPLTPFLNQSLLADYNQSYSFSRILASAHKHAEEKDPRLDLIESALAGFESSHPGEKEPGALKIVLRSYGVQQGIDNRGTRLKTAPASQTMTAGTSSTQFLPAAHTGSGSSKGKGKALAPVEDPELDFKVTQVLDVLPDLSPDYVRLLLGSHGYNGDLERVLGSLLEGNAPDEATLLTEFEQDESPPRAATRSSGYDISQRRNVFDDQEMDLSRVATGKKSVEHVSLIFRI